MSDEMKAPCPRCGSRVPHETGDLVCDEIVSLRDAHEETKRALDEVHGKFLEADAAYEAECVKVSALERRLRAVGVVRDRLKQNNAVNLSAELTAILSGDLPDCPGCAEKEARINDALNVMGPSVPSCCQGCEHEWSEALRILRGETSEGDSSGS